MNQTSEKKKTISFGLSENGLMTEVFVDGKYSYSTYVNYKVEKIRLELLLHQLDVRNVGFE